MHCSVLIPVFNTPAQFLTESVRSCLLQTLRPEEILVVDDGSTNADTLTALAQLRTLKLPGLRVLVQPRNSGVAAALNAGLEATRHDCIARMDADDIMLPHRLASQAAYRTRVGRVDALGGQMICFGQQSGIFTEHPESVTAKVAVDHPNGWFINHPTVLLDRRSVLSVGGYDPNFAGCEDMELWYRMLSRGMVIGNVPSIVLMYRKHPTQVTAQPRAVPLARFKGYLSAGCQPAF